MLKCAKPTIVNVKINNVLKQLFYDFILCDFFLSQHSEQLAIASTVSVIDESTVVSHDCDAMRDKTHSSN